MGKYDSLFGDTEDAPPAFLDKTASKYSALFAKEPEPTRQYDNTGPDVAGQLKAEAAAAPLEVARNSSMGASAANGFVNGATFGFGDELEGAGKRAADIIAGRQGKSYSQYRDDARAFNDTAQAAHPVAAGAGELGGGIASSLLLPGAGAGGIGRTMANAGAQGAVAGAGNSTADLTQGDVGGFAKDVGVSAATNAAIAGGVAKVVRGAPERVDQRLLSNISRGEAGGAAKDRLYKNLVAKAGDDMADMNEVLARHPGVKETLATTAATNPAKGARMTEGIVKDLNEKLTPIYDAIDAGPSPPMAADLQGRISALKDAFVTKGRTDIADSMETFEGHLAKHYPDPTSRLDASQLRELRKGVGQVAFKDLTQSSLPAGTEAKRAIYRAINDTIDEAGASTPGVDVARLHQLNKDASTMIAMRDVLQDRSAKAAAGRTSLFQNLLGSGLVAGGALAGGVQGAVGGLVAKQAVSGAGRLGRVADFQLAKLVQAARQGSTPAQLGQIAVELGLSRAAAEEIAQRGIGAFQNDENQQ